MYQNNAMLVNCRSCGTLFQVSAGVKSIRCALCQAITNIGDPRAHELNEAKQRQLKAILDQLTPQNFFEQVKQVNIDSAVTLTGFVSQMFDKALMEPTSCEMYANFCFHLAVELPNFSEDDKKITFKKILLNKCQEEFEREANRVEEEKTRMLGNIKLIGELYKKKMLPKKIMHKCIKKLLGQNQTPDEEDIESLCKLMSTIGVMIDHPKRRQRMDTYFNIMTKLSNNMKLSSRVRFILKDTVDLRNNKWQHRDLRASDRSLDRSMASSSAPVQATSATVSTHRLSTSTSSSSEESASVTGNTEGKQKETVPRTQSFKNRQKKTGRKEAKNAQAQHDSFRAPPTIPPPSASKQQLPLKDSLVPVPGSKDKPTSETNRAKNMTGKGKKKRKDILKAADAESLMSVQVGISHLVEREMYPNAGRNTDRTSGGPRPDRRDDDKWNKSPGSFVPGRDPRLEGAHGGSAVGSRPGQGGNHGVLRNPRGQAGGQHVGGILSGPAHPLGSQGGMQRSNSDADRWQRATGYHKGLIPSPQTPLQVMHKADKKYKIRKVSDIEEAKQRQLKAILNKLTPQNFDKLFEQVKEVNIDNAITLTGVISQIFDKALMEPTFCEMYANFCSHLAAELPDFSEDNEKITFKRLLLNKCQEEFERGEREQAEANRVEEEGEIKCSEEEREEKRIQARRRMLGNIRLIGELYKKKMLTERIMHECIKKLFRQNQTPDEEDIEFLCMLMSTIGVMIDHPKAKEHMDVYFDIMTKFSNNMKLSSRVRFMLKDSMDLRKNKWQQRRKVEGPKKIDEVHRNTYHGNRDLRDMSISAIREFYSAKDKDELALCIKELSAPSFYPSMVSTWVTDSFERKDLERDLLARLLVDLTKSRDSLLNQVHLMKGFESVLGTLEEAVIDAPKAAEFFGRILARVIMENVVPLNDIGHLIHEGGEEPGRLQQIGLAAEVLGSVLEIIKFEKGESVFNEIRTSSSLRLEDFRPPDRHKMRMLEAFFYGKCCSLYLVRNSD